MNEEERTGDSFAAAARAMRTSRFRASFGRMQTGALGSLGERLTAMQAEAFAPIAKNLAIPSAEVIAPLAARLASMHAEAFAPIAARLAAMQAEAFAPIARRLASMQAEVLVPLATGLASMQADASALLLASLDDGGVSNAVQTDASASDPVGGVDGNLALLLAIMLVLVFLAQLQNVSAVEAEEATEAVGDAVEQVGLFLNTLTELTNRWPVLGGVLVLDGLVSIGGRVRRAMEGADDDG